jgi:uncharacterized protein (TIGR03067 family)
MRRHVFALVTVGLLVTSGVAREDEAKKELEKLAGTWEAVSVEVGGKQLPEERIKDFKLIIEGDKYTTKAGERTIKGTIKIDPSKDPKTIDATRAEGDEKGKVLLGIYKLVDDDNLKLCFNEPDNKERPTEFKTAEGTKQRYYVLKRQKP